MHHSSSPKPSIFEGVTPYHWLVVIIASCGWLFDCMDQRLFILARESALRELLGSDAAAIAKIKTYIGYSTTSMMIGWATGGIIFGIMSDKMGRVKTMIATLLVYSGFTGLSGMAQSWVDFTIYRFLVGLGVGGMFGSATTLVAESVPGQFRSLALGSLQALSATGNILGSLLTLQIPPGRENLLGDINGWRVLFFVGILPSILVVPIVFVLREPEAWKKAKADAVAQGAGRNVGSPAELFRDVRWRRSTIVGLLLGLSGMIGLWAVGFFSPELITTALQETPVRAKDLKNPTQFWLTLGNSTNPVARHFQSQLTPATRARLEQVRPGYPPSDKEQSEMLQDLNTVIRGKSIYDPEVFKSVTFKEGTLQLIRQFQSAPKQGQIQVLNRQLLEQSFPGSLTELQSFIDSVRGRGLALQDVGAFLGMMLFTLMASFLSRKSAFLTAFLLCLITTIFVFSSLHTETDAYWMLPMMGFAQLGLFAGYSIYFPELFPTRLRGTGVGFCYNTVRYLAAPTPTLMGYLSTMIAFRTAAIIMSFIYLLGLVALIWAPETKGKPLPEG